ncbi:MAG: hypothetical protein RI897_1451 [Verrucomicrobiota bacterium]
MGWGLVILADAEELFGEEVEGDLDSFGIGGGGELVEDGGPVEEVLGAEDGVGFTGFGGHIELELARGDDEVGDFERFCGGGGGEDLALGGVVEVIGADDCGGAGEVDGEGEDELGVLGGERGGIDDTVGALAGEELGAAGVEESGDPVIGGGGGIWWDGEED